MKKTIRQEFKRYQFNFKFGKPQDFTVWAVSKANRNNNTEI